jgi:hypothetical protein
MHRSGLRIGSRSEGELTTNDGGHNNQSLAEANIRTDPRNEGLRELDDVEQSDVPRNLVEAYSPILRWMREPRLKSAAAARRSDRRVQRRRGQARIGNLAR